MAKRTRGIDILASILQFCDARTQSGILGDLMPILEKEHRHDLVKELRNQLVVFEDLAYANGAGLQILLKSISTRELAFALRGASESVIKNIALSMSKNMFKDLRTEIELHKNATQKEVDMAREHILAEVKSLIKENRLYIEKPDSSKIY